jgi:hypothetical protein
MFQVLDIFIFFLIKNNNFTHDTKTKELVNDQRLAHLTKTYFRSDEHSPNTSQPNESAMEGLFSPSVNLVSFLFCFTDFKSLTVGCFMSYCQDDH